MSDPPKLLDESLHDTSFTWTLPYLFPASWIPPFPFPSVVGAVLSFLSLLFRNPPIPSPPPQPFVVLSHTILVVPVSPPLLLGPCWIIAKTFLPLPTRAWQLDRSPATSAPRPTRAFFRFPARARVAFVRFAPITPLHTSPSTASPDTYNTMVGLSDSGIHAASGAAGGMVASASRSLSRRHARWRSERAQARCVCWLEFVGGESTSARASWWGWVGVGPASGSHRAGTGALGQELVNRVADAGLYFLQWLSHVGLPTGSRAVRGESA